MQRPYKTAQKKVEPFDPPSLSIKYFPLNTFFFDAGFFTGKVA
jgi:hypothetical protein